jgi:hypothetical protein
MEKQNTSGSANAPKIIFTGSIAGESLKWIIFLKII